MSGVGGPSPRSGGNDQHADDAGQPRVGIRRVQPDIACARRTARLGRAERHQLVVGQRDRASARAHFLGPAADCVGDRLHVVAARCRAPGWSPPVTNGAAPMSNRDRAGVDGAGGSAADAVPARHARCGSPGGTARAVHAVAERQAMPSAPSST